MRSLCPINVALEMLGDKWTILILRDMLIFGKRYYGEFLKSSEGISTNLLADRLKRLEKWHMVVREQGVVKGAKVRYELTEKARRFGPVMVKLLMWSGEFHETWMPEGMRELLDSDPVTLEKQLIGMIEKASARREEG
ncbi:helix-turn-helix transcriptional regulator [Planctomycetota bacterium]|nr:helix-turn-helix transcriptional regulator [Planctomycetota bacterium]